ncbi:hypothetical protein BFJ69_g16185 [Fusarium oxysporum]|uniref:FluG domain-containing protein n=1 Tax=Fusarium oxysporum TaxID=5507 RepID=A0A420MC12_FUSOX|nr:hypothetical protein BFJ69_g16185 [Fusarium oxysporum]
MLYSKLRDDIAAQSLNSGQEKPWTPRFTRRGASNAANRDTPDSVRNQIMRHDPQFTTFHHAYLNEIAHFDLQNAFLEEEKQSQLFRLVAHISLTRDPRATADMVPKDVWANLPPDPDIAELEEQRAQLKQGNYRINGHPDEKQIRKLTEDIRKKNAQREKRAVKEYHRIFQLKIKAVDLMVTLCNKRETVKRDRIRQRTNSCLPINTEPLETEHKTLYSPARFPLLMHAAQCSNCISNKRLYQEERTFTYCRPTVMNDHFDDIHLVRREQAERSGEKIRCEHPKCRDVKLKHINHFRRHVQEVHGVTLWTSEQVQQRRQRNAKRRHMAKGNCQN